MSCPSADLIAEPPGDLVPDAVPPGVRPPWLDIPVHLVRTDTLTRDAWLAWRHRGLGGSDAAAVLGVSRYRNPWDV